jgi:hypothetical protein
MNSFGGFSSNPDIKSFLQAQQADFIDMVRSYSVLLRASKDLQIINTAQTQAYPRIGLILSAAKNLDNTYLFSDPTNPTDIVALYQRVITLMISTDSPFSEGITRVAAALTAAILIRSIPLDDDIKNVTSAKQIEEGALNDLAEITKLYTQTKAPAAAILSAGGTSASTLYISLGIDSTSLPATYFNLNPPDQIVRIEEVYPNSNVKLLDSLNIDPSEIALCWYYVTHADEGGFKATTSTTNTLDTTNTIVTGSTTNISTQIGSSELLQPVEGAFGIPDGSTAEDIIELLSDALNEAVTFYDSNVLVSPNVEPTSLTSISMIKRKLYDSDSSDPTGIYDKKVASFRMLTNLCSLRFDARRMSAIISTELIIVRFFTVSKTAIANSRFNTTGSSYQGIWSSATSYAAKSIVTYDGLDYYCANTVSSGGANPYTNNTVWKVLYNSHNDLINYRSLPTSKDYVDGILYGLLPNYTFLDRRGPHSLIIGVEKGTVKTTTGSRVGSGSTTDPAVKEKDIPIPNTFYFRLTGAPVTGTLSARVSSSNSTVVAPWSIDLVDASAEDVALAFLNSLYTVSQASDTLGVLVYPHAVEIVAFQTTKEEVRVVVDITQVPAGLEIATGTPIEEKTPYKNKPRSVSVDAKVARTTTQSPTDQTEELLTKFSGSASLTKHKKSSGLQHVYDKMDFLNTIEKRRIPPW